MRMLVLGGTSFVGRHIVEAALADGHEVTLFNRGQTNPGLFDGCDKRTGDRSTGDYSSLAEGSWDAVIDVNAYIPRVVREAAAAVEGRIGRYTFISTGSVYDEPGDGPIDESHPRAVLDDPSTEEVTNSTYGGLKALCEDEVRRLFGSAGTIVRPGIVAGPYDPTDRFTYWVRRAARGGVAAAPARPDQPVQVVHARDLGDFVVRATVEGLAGPFNGVGDTISLESVLAACGIAEVAWIPEEVLRERKVGFPLWIPSGMGIDGLFRSSNAAASAHGFVNRPLADTAADTLAWDRARPGFPDGDLPGAPSAEVEAELIKECAAS